MHREQLELTKSCTVRNRETGQPSRLSRPPSCCTTDATACIPEQQYGVPLIHCNAIKLYLCLALFSSVLCPAPPPARGRSNSHVRVLRKVFLDQSRIQVSRKIHFQCYTGYRAPVIGIQSVLLIVYSASCLFDSRSFSNGGALVRVALLPVEGVCSSPRVIP